MNEFHAKVVFHDYVTIRLKYEWNRIDNGLKLANKLLREMKIYTQVN